MKVFQNGVWTKTQKPIYQIGVEQSDGSMQVVDATPMSKADAEAKLKAMQPKKAAPAPKPAAAVEAKPKKAEAAPKKTRAKRGPYKKR